MNKRIVSYFILIFLSVSYTFANIEISADKLFKFKSSNSKEQGNLQNTANNPIQFEINTDYCASVFLSGQNHLTINSFMLSNNQAVTLDLSTVRTAVNENTEWYAVENGVFIKKQGPYITTYSGKITGQPHSDVFINYYHGKLIGYVKDEKNEVFTISPDLKAKGENTNHFVLPRLAEKHEKDDNPFVCLTEDFTGTETEEEDQLKYRHDEIQANSKVLQVPILCEGSYDYYLLLGSNFDYASAYIASVINLSSKIYLDNINVNLAVNKVVIRTDQASCPYRNSADLSDKLGVMPNVWMGRKDNNALVVLFANLYDQPSGTIVAGISMGGNPNVGSLCSVSRGYCALGIRGQFQYPTLNYTWDINVATHEIGHNFSAPHTHHCYYKPNMIDTCVTQTQPFEVWDACVKSGNPIPVPGTIMSYCHTTNPTRSVELVFHPRTKPLMRKAVESSFCISEAPGTFLALLHPLGDSAYQAKKPMQIRWTSKSVQSIDIYYSLDAGQTWKDIAKAVPASDSIFNWTVPDVNSNQAKVAISATGNPNINDRSLTVFSIFKAGLFVVSPVRNERIGQNALYILKWTITFEEKVKIEFTSNGGSNWSVIFPNATLGTIEWLVPMIESENCKIRITSLTDATLIGESGIFAIGKQTAKITSPKGGEVFCIGEFNDLKWTSDFISYLFLEYTTNNGDTWRKVTQMPITASIGGYSWKVPNVKAGNVRFRLSTNVNKVYVYLDSTFNSISIDSCLSGVEELKNEDLFMELSPNPASATASLVVTSNLTMPEICLVTLIDEKGALVKTISEKFSIGNGKTNLDITMNDVANGTYFVQIKNDRINKIIKIIKI